MIRHFISCFYFFAFLFLYSCHSDKTMIVEQWKETEITLTSSGNYSNPYTDLEVWMEFSGPGNLKITRPAFWDGNNVWKVRFTSPVDSGLWEWKSFCSNPDDNGLHSQQGTLSARPYSGNNELIRKGLLRMSAGKRNVVHANGDVFLMIGDTPWALPWRGTYASVTEYAQNRQKLGFNTALLMSLQPDKEAKGPRSRTERDGFDVAFEDLPEGHINQLNPSYFQYVDSLRNILLQHGIVPVFQPVFHGFGWKGLKVLGHTVDTLEYNRYCRYLVARYGAQPAMWLPGADSDGRDPSTKTGGETFEKWDAYQQPTGLHYSPFDEYTPDWWDRPVPYVPHMNKSYQDASWLDFQWCQTGHGGAHLPHKVAKMYNNLPTKAVANGEPTYEGIRDSANGSGWWQGHEAWLQFTSGGTMGVVYGAGSLWNWKLYPDEEGWADWANTRRSWKEAIELPGAVYVGLLGKILNGLDISDIELHPELAGGKLCLAKTGKLYIVYLPEGGNCKLNNIPQKGSYKWFDPKTATVKAEGNLSEMKDEFKAPTNDPYVLIVNHQE